MIPLVDQCVAAGLILAQDQCYGYKIPPILGGQYAIENVEPTDLSVHYSLLADIFRQTKRLARRYSNQDGRNLNQIEILFSLLQRKTLNGGSFKTKDQLREAIEAFFRRHNERAKPFRWRKRDVNATKHRVRMLFAKRATNTRVGTAAFREVDGAE